jgi:flavin reductase (DIM6/NTAB) family NADH-FMN oxidoreductase RutF
VEWKQSRILISAKNECGVRVRSANKRKRRAKSAEHLALKIEETRCDSGFFYERILVRSSSALISAHFALRTRTHLSQEAGFFNFQKEQILRLIIFSMHITSEPSILYFGTPVIVITSENENGTYNLAPISSVFWLGWRCIIGIGLASQTAQNLIRKGECVINLPSENEVEHVDKLALLTGRNPVPEKKLLKGYRYEPDKFSACGFTAMPSEFISIPSVKECPVQMEAIVTSINAVGEDEESFKNRIISVELKVIKIRMDTKILATDSINHVDPDKWRPLIMSFQQFYGLGERVAESTLAQIPERLYK